MLKFMIFSAGKLLKTSVFDEPVVSIGRLPENTIPLTGPGISRRHLRIEQDRDGSYLLVDLDSLNGTTVNGTKVRSCPLHSGDVIVVGSYSIIYEELASRATTLPIEKFEGAPFSSQGFETVVQKRPEGEEKPAPELVQVSGNGSFKLERSFMTIGSGEVDDIRISGFMIGRQQAFVSLENDGWHIATQKMIGKLRVNGRPVKSTLLHDKDRIEIGSVALRFVEAG